MAEIAKFPVFSLMIREFEAESDSYFGHLAADLETKLVLFSLVLVEIPYPTEQGIILEEQGIFST